MFIVFLIVNFIVALIVGVAIVLPFRKPILNLLRSRFSEEAAVVWGKYLALAIIIIGITVGTRVWDLEKFVPSTGGLELTRDFAAIEVYKTTIATLQVDALLLFVVLVATWVGSILKK